MKLILQGYQIFMYTYFISMTFWELVFWFWISFVHLENVIKIFFGPIIFNGFVLSMGMQGIIAALFRIFRHSSHQEAYKGIQAKLRTFRNGQLAYGITMTGVCFLPIFIPRVAENVYIIFGIFNFVVVHAAYTLIAKRKDDHYQAMIESDLILAEFEKKESIEHQERLKLQKKPTDHPSHLDNSRNDTSVHAIDQDDGLANTAVTTPSISPALTPTKQKQNSATPKEKELFNPFTHQTIPGHDPKNEGSTLEPPSPLALSETSD